MNGQDQFKIQIVQPLPVEASHTVQRESILDDHGTGKNAQEPAEYGCDYGKEGVAPCMGINNDLFFEPFGAGGPDVVHG